MIIKQKFLWGIYEEKIAPLMTYHHIYILQVVITKFTLLIGKTVNFELYIGGIGGGHL